MTILRTLKHWALSPIPVKCSFPEEALGEITQCIEKAETTTSAEFEVIIERSLPLDILKSNSVAHTRAEQLFAQYRVWDTEDNNGVLIYLNLSDHAIELVLDRAAARLFTQEQLDVIVHKMSEKFQQKLFAKGICEAITELAKVLSAHFPNKPVNDPLPNSPIIL